jgi:hypothetical protein
MHYEIPSGHESVSALFHSLKAQLANRLSMDIYISGNQIDI